MSDAALATIDAAAEDEGLSRSEYLVRAATERADGATLVMKPHHLDAVRGSCPTQPEDYISELITDRTFEWQQAVCALRRAGWRREEILAACHQLETTRGPTTDPEVIVIELSSPGPWRLPPELMEEWPDRVEELRKSPKLASCLAAAAREYWSLGGHAGRELARRLGEGDSSMAHLHRLADEHRASGEEFTIDTMAKIASTLGREPTMNDWRYAGVDAIGIKWKAKTAGRRSGRR